MTVHNYGTIRKYILIISFMLFFSIDTFSQKVINEGKMDYEYANVYYLDNEIRNLDNIKSKPKDYKKLLIGKEYLYQSTSAVTTIRDTLVWQEKIKIIGNIDNLLNLVL